MASAYIGKFSHWYYSLSAIVNGPIFLLLFQRKWEAEISLLKIFVSEIERNYIIFVKYGFKAHFFCLPFEGAQIVPSTKPYYSQKYLPPPTAILYLRRHACTTRRSHSMLVRTPRKSVTLLALMRPSMILLLQGKAWLGKAGKERRRRRKRKDRPLMWHKDSS